VKYPQLLGQSYFRDDKDRYFAAPDRFVSCMGLRLIGAKGEVLDRHETVIDSLRWAVEMARTPEASGRALRV